MSMPDIPFIPALFSSHRGDAVIDMLVLHYTDGPSLEHCVALFRNPARPVSCHYIVGLDGRIVQMVRDRDCAWHCGVSRWKGRSRCNPWALGIEIVNWGKLVQRAGRFYCWPDDYTTPYEGPAPVFAKDAWWAPYPAVQVERVTALSRHLVERYRIPLINIVRHSDIAPKRKIDPGPAFPWRRFKARMRATIQGRW
jgi:N-acetyl-anhydromuramyl-L-alanine amidase AmpD